MAPTPKSEPPWASESVQSLDATALAHGPANNGCGAQSPFAQNPSQLLDRLCIGQNVRGLANDAHRKALFTALSEFHIVALSETHALPSDEARWARDWHGQRTFWSSVSDGTHHRGVALLFSDDLVMTDVRVLSDNDDTDTTRPFAGRFLAVEATLYHKHKMLFVITYAPGSYVASADASENAAFFDTVRDIIEQKVPDAKQRTIVWHGDHNNIDNPPLDEHPPTTRVAPHAGAAALSAVASTLRITDAFRHYHPYSREFTRVPRGPVAATNTASRRLDRGLVSTHSLAKAACPRVKKVWHLRATDPAIAPRFLNGHTYTVKASDHGAVVLQIAFSQKPTPKRNWTFNLKHLLDTTGLEKMREIINHHAAIPGRSAAARMNTIRNEVRTYVKETEEKEASNRQHQIHTLREAIDDLDDRLGEGLSPPPPGFQIVGSALSFRNRERATADQTGHAPRRGRT